MRRLALLVMVPTQSGVRYKKIEEIFVGVPDTPTPVPPPASLLPLRCVWKVWWWWLAATSSTIGVDHRCDQCDGYAGWVPGDCDATQPEPGYHLYP